MYEERSIPVKVLEAVWNDFNAIHEKKTHGKYYYYLYHISYDDVNYRCPIDYGSKPLVTINNDPIMELSNDDYLYYKKQFLYGLIYPD